MNEISRFLDNPSWLVVAALLATLATAVLLGRRRRNYTNKPFRSNPKDSADEGQTVRHLFLADWLRSVTRAMKRVNRRSSRVSRLRVAVAGLAAAALPAHLAFVSVSQTVTEEKAKIPPTLTKTIVALLVLGDVIVVKAAFEMNGKTGLEALMGSAAIAVMLVLGGKYTADRIPKEKRLQKFGSIVAAVLLVGVSIALYLLRLKSSAAWLGLALAPAAGSMLLALMNRPGIGDCSFS